MKLHGIELHHLTAAASHFKGYHDALGKIVDRIRVKREKAGDRIEHSWQLFVAVWEEKDGLVAEADVGDGYQAINAWHVRYVTSVQKDYDARRAQDGGKYADYCLFIDRKKVKSADVKALAGSSKIHVAIGRDRNDPGHLEHMPFACVCRACRDFRPEDCTMADWFGHLRHDTMVYVDGNRAANAEAAAQKKACKEWGQTLVAGDYVVFRIGTKKELREEEALGRLDQFYVACVEKVSAPRGGVYSSSPLSPPAPPLFFRCGRSKPARPRRACCRAARRGRWWRAGVTW